jgi:Uncharacterized protein conserved in bacteria
MNKINYQRELDKLLDKFQQEERIPRLLIHSCCAPCSSYVLEYLSDYFYITIFFYNPNITEQEEYERRVKEQKKLIEELNPQYPILMEEGTYNQKEFFNQVKGLEHIEEGGKRCATCFSMRLREAAMIAKERDFEYFTTTLTISPLKNAAMINEIGTHLSKEYEVAFLPSDFKKKNGYQRSVELSKQYGLYRQDYCGCIFSKRKVNA